MIIAYCPYPTRQIKKTIQHILSLGVKKISKINYSKWYTRVEKKTIVDKESILHIYIDDTKNNQEKIIATIKKTLPEASIFFIEHSVL